MGVGSVTPSYARVRNIARTFAAKACTSTAALPPVDSPESRQTLRPRHAAGGIVGPVAVEPDHAPLHAPANAEPAGIFANRIVDGMGRAIRDPRDPAAEAARDRLRRALPGAERGLADAIDADDFQVGIPEL